MLCEKCSKANATTHIRSVINGVVHEKHLCSHCAASEGYSEVKNNNLSQMLSSMFGDTLNTSSNSRLKRCNCCGSTFEHIAQSGKCGCSECYTTFYEQLLPYFKRVHGSTKHIGKIPNMTVPAQNTDKESIEDLQILLNKYIATEQYEQAAVIRDKIKCLKGEKL